jgi:hypothetical protein
MLDKSHKPTWTSFEEATKADWDAVMDYEEAYNAALPDRILDAIRSLDEEWTPYPVNRYQHSLQAATRAYEDGADEELVVAALTHEMPSDRRVMFETLPPERLVLVETAAALVDNSVFVNLELGAAYQDHVRTTARKAEGQTVFLGNCMMALRYVLKRGGRGFFPAYLAAEYIRSGALVQVDQSPDLMLPLYLVTRPDSSAFEDILDCLQGLRDPA